MLWHCPFEVHRPQTGLETLVLVLSHLQWWLVPLQDLASFLLWLAGFFGKFYVFTAAINSGAPDLGLLWLVILAIAGLGYLLGLLNYGAVEADTPDDVDTGHQTRSPVNS